jgi:hypothetical protein
VVIASGQDAVKYNAETGEVGFSGDTQQGAIPAR